MTNPFPTSGIISAAVFSFLAYFSAVVFYSRFPLEYAYLSIASKSQKKTLLKPDNLVKDKDNFYLVAAVLLAAFALRVVLSNWIVGNKTDINCFTAWANRAATKGLNNFYSGGSFSDYPPGYITVLAAMGKIANLFGHTVKNASGAYDSVYVFLVKLPSFIADLASAYLVYHLARKKLRFEPSLVLMALVAFNPVIMYNSAGYGQVDQIFTVLLALSIILLMTNKPIWAGTVYGLSIVLKPQALMAGPILAIAYFMYIFDPNFFSTANMKSNDDVKKRIIKTAIAVLSAVMLIVVSALPYHTAEYPFYQIILDKYLGTATSYKYVSINAYNLYGMIGANWASLDKIAFGCITYGTLGTIGMVISVAITVVLYIFGRKKHRGALMLSIAYLFSAMFTIGHYMHERYIIPTILLLILAYVIYSDRRLLMIAALYSIPIFMNCMASFYYCEYIGTNTAYWDLKLIKWVSIINVVMFVIFTYVCVDIMIRGRTIGDIFRKNSEDLVLSNAVSSGEQEKGAK